MKSPFEILWRIPRFAPILARKPRFLLKVMEHHARVKATGQPLIRAIEYAVTYQCQATCDKCSAMRMLDERRPRLDPDEIRRVGDACHKLGNYEANMTGGEPLLDGDLEAIVQCWHPESTFIGINTNGKLLDRKRIESLRDAGVDLLKISLDSPVAQEHDASRGLPGLYEHIFDMLSLVREIRGIRGHLCMVSTREAIEQGKVTKVLDLAHSHDATLGIVLPAAIGGWDKKHEVLLEPHHRQQLEKIGKDPAVFLQGNVGKSEFVCPCGTSEIYITTYGDIIPCPFIQIAFGNVRDEPFESIYRRMAGWKKGESKPMCSSAEDPDFQRRYVDPLTACQVTPVNYKEHPQWKGEEKD